MTGSPRIVFCHCSYAQVVPAEVKAEVLRRLSESGHPFEAVADLCEMSARQDPLLRDLAQGPVKIAACYPRAVKWLFAAGQAPLDPAQAEVLNMRVASAAEVSSELERPGLSPNLPEGKPVASDAPAVTIS